MLSFVQSDALINYLDLTFIGVSKVAEKRAAEHFISSSALLNWTDGWLDFAKIKKQFNAVCKLYFWESLKNIFDHNTVNLETYFFQNKSLLFHWCCADVNHWKSISLSEKCTLINHKRDSVCHYVRHFGYTKLQCENHDCDELLCGEKTSKTQKISSCVNHNPDWMAISEETETRLKPFISSFLVNP